MNKELSEFIKQCELKGFADIDGAYFVCMLDDKCYYSNDICYTYEEVYEDYMYIKNKERKELEDWNLFMEIDMARQSYLDMYGHI